METPTPVYSSVPNTDVVICERYEKHAGGIQPEFILHNWITCNETKSSNTLPSAGAAEMPV